MLVSEMYGGRVKLLGKFFRHFDSLEIYVFAQVDLDKFALIDVGKNTNRWSDPVKVSHGSSIGFSQEEAGKIFARKLSEWEEVSPEVAAEYIIESRRED